MRFQRRPYSCQLAESWLKATGTPVTDSILFRIADARRQDEATPRNLPTSSAAAMTMSAAPVSNKIPGNRLHASLLLVCQKYDSHPLFEVYCRMAAFAPYPAYMRWCYHYHIITTSNRSRVIKRFDLNLTCLPTKISAGLPPARVILRSAPATAGEA